MKVFINSRSGGYSGWLIVASDNSKEEEHGVMHRDLLDFDAGQYPFEKWKELPDVEYHGESPKILAENGYT